MFSSYISRAFCIAEDHLKHVKTALGNFSRGKDLGLELGLRATALEEIERDHKFVKDQLHEVLQRWLKRIDNIDKNVCPTWSQLVKAVEPINRALSDEIKDKYC